MAYSILYKEKRRLFVIRSLAHHKPNTLMNQVHAKACNSKCIRCSFYVEVVIRERLSNICPLHYIAKANVGKISILSQQF